MPKIRLEDKDVEIEAEEGKDVLTALLENDIQWMHACGGFCNCTTCAIRVIEGSENLSEMEDDEANTLRRFEGEEVLENPVRLSCQAKLKGDITIEEPEW